MVHTTGKGGARFVKMRYKGWMCGKMIEFWCCIVIEWPPVTENLVRKI